MVSCTQQTKTIRARKRVAQGKKAKRAARRLGTTPVFPVHPEGYDAKAADAKPADKLSSLSKNGVYTWQITHPPKSATASASSAPPATGPSVAMSAAS